MNRSRQRRESEEESLPKRTIPKPKIVPTRLRIVAGELGGRKIDYNGDPATRPMKERTREAVFSLLGGYLYDTFAIDLFGGTGILAFESVSRGSERAIILEMSRTAVATILLSMEQLRLGERIDVYNVDTLRWMRNLELARVSWPNLPWVVYCCPPYKMWKSDTERLCTGLMAIVESSPSGSRLVCETEHDFDLRAALPSLNWDIRNYAPANIGISVKQ